MVMEFTFALEFTFSSQLYFIMLSEFLLSALRRLLLSACHFPDAVSRKQYREFTCSFGKQS